MSIKSNFDKINTEIKLTSKTSNSIKLLVVSKKRSIVEIEQLITYGQHYFGESYAQESKTKIVKINNNNIQWHFIGHIQSNKTRIISKYFSWCHTIQDKKIAILLNKFRSKKLPKLNVLIQMNIRKIDYSLNTNKSNIYELAKKINQLDNLIFRGIMAMPYLKTEYSDQIKSYKDVKICFNYFKKQYSTVDTLSIGTSHDIHAAINSGSTLLRIGSAIFNTQEK